MYKIFYSPKTLSDEVVTSLNFIKSCTYLFNILCGEMRNLYYYFLPGILCLLEIMTDGLNTIRCVAVIFSSEMK